ncbi:MAG: peptide chain release factor N(5)-glutamine methyltransferase [Prevotella sp.]|uniref:N5-glutamine methyltransferase family protein n=1 Tax=Prevotella sp. AGR2160 TaxID=1280674 RepID=UPI0004186982|nr:HemK/PrmC family methyltransferase [Prevotella sp. AGR2160]MDD5861396.1 peptide chain release factor N(5)-glutamine methyltransferase [Prevotella sp.]
MANNTYNALVQSLCKSLPPEGTGVGRSLNDARAVVRYLLEEDYGLTLTDIVCGAVDRLSAKDRQRLNAQMEQLRQGVPVQQVLGYATFCGRRFKVTPDTLIPRPETERLGEASPHPLPSPFGFLSPGNGGTEGGVKTIEGTGERPASFLDIGTGTGCLAITLALNHPDARVTAWDIAPATLAVARENARTLGATVDFRLQDALSPPDDHTCWDLIVSNPPYIAAEEAKDMSPIVLDHEPARALFVPDDDPLLFYRAITRYARKALKPNGELRFEINPRFAIGLLRMMEQEGFHSVLLKDDNGKDRYIYAGLSQP